jgi:hypothetical protein
MAMGSGAQWIFPTNSTPFAKLRAIWMWARRWRFKPSGTGKTTTLAAIAESLAQRKFLYLVFNRAAADEAEHKMPSNVMVRTAHALAFRRVGYVYKSRLAGSPWAWFPYLKEKMPRALDSVVRIGRDTTSAGTLRIRILEQFLRTTDGAIGAIHAPYWCDDNVAATARYAAEAPVEEHLQA